MDAKDMPADPDAEIVALRERVALLERQVKLLAERTVRGVTADEMRAAGFQV